MNEGANTAGASSCWKKYQPVAAQHIRKNANCTWQLLTQITGQARHNLFIRLLDLTGAPNELIKQTI